MNNLDLILANSAEVLLKDELKKKLSTGNKLRVKLGFDPTAPDLHLGHVVVLNKLKTLQDLGHTIMIVIGDFTAMIGDPTGKNITRPSLSEQEVTANAKTYLAQIGKILELERLEIHFNSSWLSNLGTQGIIKLAATKTVSRMLERDDFSKRFSNGMPIAIHEFLYPLLQAYDSLHLQADLEIGGTDQRFNLLMGRELQKHYDYAPQVCIMMPILEGTNGIDKMSKSLNNYIAIQETNIEMFGKIMSISDDLLWHYMSLISSKNSEEISALKQQAGKILNPRDIKVDFAKEIITKFHSFELAIEAEQDFVNRFKNKLIGTNIKTVVIESDILGLPIILKLLGFTASTSEAIRYIEQGAVKVDEHKVVDKNYQFFKHQEYIVQLGKRHYNKLIIK
jgi:tyrosyl-tRNA synthetase